MDVFSYFFSPYEPISSEEEDFPVEFETNIAGAQTSGCVIA